MPHDRRRVVLAPAEARQWMGLAVSAEKAEQLALTRSLQPDAFEWYSVSTDVNNDRNNDERLIQPIE